MSLLSINVNNLEQSPRETIHKAWRALKGHDSPGSVVIRRRRIRSALRASYGVKLTDVDTFECLLLAEYLGRATEVYKQHVTIYLTQLPQALKGVVEVTI